jgi:hypothetical protein
MRRQREAGMPGAAAEIEDGRPACDPRGEFAELPQVVSLCVHRAGQVSPRLGAELPCDRALVLHRWGFRGEGEPQPSMLTAWNPVHAGMS